jgi:uncharacterized protein YciI
MMKHFLMEITYTIPVEEIGEVVAEHLVFLQIGYDRGWILLSGPQNPRRGEILLARALTLLDLQRYFQEDVLWRRGLARYRFVDFEPVKWQPFLARWVAGKTVEH